MAKKSERAPGYCNEGFSAFGGHLLHAHLPAAKVAAFAAMADGDGGRLAQLGVTDVEQLVALANTEEARGNLAATLEVEVTEVEAILKEAKKILPSEVADEMAHPLPPMYPLGVPEPPSEMRAAAEAPPPTGEAFDAAVVIPSANLIPNMSPIRNQGARGTCVAFTLTAINEYYRKIHGVVVDLSEQHLYYETKLIDGSPTVCGTWQKFAAQVLANRGQCRELVWPYNPNLPCNNNGTMPPTARTDALNYRLPFTPLAPRSAPAIKAALADRRPVGISIPVYNSWYTSPETRRSGRITMPLTGDPQVGGHALCIVGYQDQADGPGGGYFLIRNHWSTGWGYQCPYGAGYGTIPYAYITGYCWEAYTLAGPVATEVEHPAPPPDEPKRTVTITIRGNVNIVIE